MENLTIYEEADRGYSDINYGDDTEHVDQYTDYQNSKPKKVRRPKAKSKKDKNNTVISETTVLKIT